MTDPSKLISIMKVILGELERSLSTAPQVAESEDARAEQLKGQIDRLDTALKKRQAAERRKRELGRENKRNR